MTAAESSGMSLLVLKTVGALFLVIGLMILCLYLLRRFGRLHSGGFTQKENIQMVGQTYVGPKQKIAVFQLRGKLLVVGVCESSLTLLTEIEIDEHDHAPFEQVLAKKNHASSGSDLLPDSGAGGNSESGSGC